MKGDLILLGAVGAAMAAIPAAVLLWSGQPLLTEPSGPVSLPVSTPTAQSTGSVPEAVPTQKQEDTPLPEESSSAPAEAPGSASATPQEPPAQGEEDALPAGVSGLWHTPVETLRILDQGTGEVAELSLLQYTQYAIAAEMPADYHMEALKAQGVAALTYGLHQAIAQRSLPEEQRDPALA